MTVVPRYTIVFNPGNSPIQIDEDGRECYPQGWAAGNLEYCRLALSSEKLIELDPDTVNDKSNPDVILVKEMVTELNKDVKKEQRRVDRKEARTEEKAENK